MKTKLVIALTFLFATHIYSQKITKILYKDTARSSIGGVMYKKQAHRMVIEGVYNGKDLFIKNGFGSSGIGWCIIGLKVNGNYTTDEINAQEFKIDLNVHKLKIGETFTVIMVYKDSCNFKEPLLMNQGAIKKRDSSGKNSLVIEGTNWNSNLLVVNPRSGNEYGIKEVWVNGQKVEGITNDIFEIAFYKMKIPYETKVRIEFKYENDCDPFIINPEVINF